LDSPTSYKNAVVGLFSLYGDVPADEKVSLRLQSRCVARMPEEKALTLSTICGPTFENHLTLRWKTLQ